LGWNVLMDTDTPRRYLTIDRWRSAAEYERFLSPGSASVLVMAPYSVLRLTVLKVHIFRSVTSAAGSPIKARWGEAGHGFGVA
jgi:hypothetical protein